MADGDEKEERIYPRLVLPQHDRPPHLSPNDVGSITLTGATCRHSNRPTQLTFLRGYSHEGELLSIGWESGQITFLPMYFEE